jgi:hypothetical protein
LKVDFECTSISQIENEKTTIYKVRFKSKQGHTLILSDVSSAILEGYSIGSKIAADIINPQTTLEGSEQ